MLKNAFDTALAAGKTWLWREMYKSLTHNISMNGDPALMRTRFGKALDLVEQVIDRNPALGVQFAGNLYIRDWHGYERARSAALIWHHAEAAWAADPAATRKILDSAALSSKEAFYHNAFVGKLYKLAPELEPGPWGSRNQDMPAHFVRG